jgi:hypothetical protein
MAEISTDDIDETARMLGVRRQAAPSSGSGANSSYLVMPSDIEETARLLGVKPAGEGVVPKAVKTTTVKKNIVLPGRQEIQPGGKVAYEPGDTITPKEQELGANAGLDRNSSAAFRSPALSPISAKLRWGH